jgi:hypothetical protein
MGFFEVRLDYWESTSGLSENQSIIPEMQFGIPKLPSIILKIQSFCALAAIAKAISAAFFILGSIKLLCGMLKNKLSINHFGGTNEIFTGVTWLI